MPLPLVLAVAVALAQPAFPAEVRAPVRADSRSVASYRAPETIYDPRAENELFALVNRARLEAELPPLKTDSGLIQAAREHAAMMAAKGELSHQFSGEAALAQRLAENSGLYLDEAAENAALADSPDRAHSGLMLSAAHRENLLHPSYNVVGIGVVRRGNTLYVVQDFGHNLPVYSPTQAEDLVARSLNDRRDQVKLPALERHDGSATQSEACSMGRQDLIRTSGTSRLPGHYLVRYTTTEPQSLPLAASRPLIDREVRAFSVGACFTRSSSYPNGVYWMMLVFY